MKPKFRLSFKSIFIIGGGLFFLYAYWYVSEQQSEGENQGPAIIAFDAPTDVKKVKGNDAPNKTKKEIYEEAQVDEKKKKTDLLSKMQAAEDFSLQEMSAIPDPSKIREKEEEKSIKPRYPGWSEKENESTASSKQEAAIEVKSKPDYNQLMSEPPVKAASISRRGSTDPVQQKKKANQSTKQTATPENVSQAQSDDDYFNGTISNNKVDEFKTSTDTKTQSTLSMIKCKVDGNHDVKVGGQIRFRTTQAFTYNNITFPRNTIFNGKVAFGNERMFVVVDKIPYNKGYIPINLQLHDADMEKGIYAPVSKVNEQGIDGATDGLSSVLQMASTGMPVANAASGLIGQTAGGLLRTASRGEQKVSVGDSFEVFFQVVESKD